MPDPREAIFDVLQAKKQRAEEERRRADAGTTVGGAWAAYEEANELSQSAYAAKRNWQG